MKKSVKILLALFLCLTFALAQGCASSCKSCKSTEESTAVTTEEETTKENKTSKSTEETVKNITQKARETSKETETEEPAPTVYYSFGKPVSEAVYRINEATLENEKSGVVDVLQERSYTKGEVLSLIESYNPDSYAKYEGASGILTEDFLDYRNLEALKTGDSTEKVALKYGILVESPDVRSFPTSKALLDSRSFDMFQESKLNYGTGVIVLHETDDGGWAFVQGTNYAGWIRSDSIAFCSFEEMTDYLTPDQFLVSMTANGDHAYDRLGVIIPYESKSSKQTGWLTLLPARDQNGNLKIQQYFLQNSQNETFVEGFLEYSDAAAVLQMQKLLGLSYGWGDTEGYYDCSSTVEGVYALFGLVLPRNTGALKYSGLNQVDISEKTREEKLAILKEHPGSILLMPGHAQMMEKVDGEKCYVLHNTTQYCTEAEGQGLKKVFQVIESEICSTYFAGGSLMLDALTTVLYVE